jgi:RNase H-fold protein (predicted Holliday junction resolvase)
MSSSDISISKFPSPHVHTHTISSAEGNDGKTKNENKISVLTSSINALDEKSTRPLKEHTSNIGLEVKGVCTFPKMEDLNQYTAESQKIIKQLRTERDQNVSLAEEDKKTSKKKNMLVAAAILSMIAAVHFAVAGLILVTSGVGIPVGLPLIGVASLLGLTSVILIAKSNKYDLHSEEIQQTENLLASAEGKPQFLEFLIQNYSEFRNKNPSIEDLKGFYFSKKTYLDDLYFLNYEIKQSGSEKIPEEISNRLSEIQAHLYSIKYEIKSLKESPYIIDEGVRSNLDTHEKMLTKLIDSLQQTENLPVKVQDDLKTFLSSQE